jgi:hypothetical protein
MSFKRDAGGRLMKPCLGDRGYLIVGLWANCERKTMLVHRLVTEAFIPNTESKPQVNHINGDKLDNRVENLEWATSSENTQHSYDTGLQVPVTGEKHHKATVSDELVQLAVAMYATGFYTQRQLAKIFGVSQRAICDWVNNNTRRVTA